MWKDFRTFVMRGNVLDLAVAVIIGVAFGKIVTSLVNDIIMPPVGLLLGKVNFSSLFINLSGKSYPSLATAKAAGAATINYGAFISTVVDFLIVAFILFLIIRTFTRMAGHFNPPPPATPVTTRECPYCISSIPLKATRCPHCTSEMKS
ncbi:MAG: large conductance mechanosensitive channel protein MscL [Phycisphaerae bacterium]